MEKTVTGIDLEELKAAREEMLKEMGISSDEPKNQPKTEAAKAVKEDSSAAGETVDVLDDDEFLSELEKLNDELAKQSANDDKFSVPEEKDPLPEVSGAENDELLDMIENYIASDASQPSAQKFKCNLSHYDVFAQYEINPPKQKYQENFAESEPKPDGMINLEPTDDFDDDFDAELDDETAEINEIETEETISLGDELSAENNLPSEAEEFYFYNLDGEKTILESADEDLGELPADEETLPKPNQDTKNSAVEIEAAENETALADDSAKIQAENSESETLSDDEFNEIIRVKTEELKSRREEPEVAKKLELLPEIEPVNFVNVLSTQDFKTSDNLTFVLGRSEQGNILFENLKQSYNIAFFANENSYEMLNTMLLSFMLKNSPQDFKLALCDGAEKHNFNYYQSSKYLLSDIAAGDDAICQTLGRVMAELEDRYRTLARFNVRSVDEYNIVAKSANAQKLSQILLVVDGYSELMVSSNFESIKSSLYQILRLGRIAGIHVVVVASRKIDEDIINFNLPSRIGFKCSQHDDSISMIGEPGINKLASKNEYFYSGIHSENAQHLRQPMISDAIIKILIDNIEK